MTSNIIEDSLKKIRLCPGDKTPFLDLSKFFRSNGMNDTSFYFCKKYLKHHPNDLNVHNELSIVSYYVDKIEQGYKSCEEILLSFDNSFSKDFTCQNILFYVKPIIISKQVKINIPFDEDNNKDNNKCNDKDNNEDNNKNRFPMNASIIKKKDKFIIVVRTVNYSFDKEGKWIISGKNAISRNYVVKISPQYDILNKTYNHINDDILVGDPNILWKGLEDVRIFLYKKEYWFTCVSPETHPKKYTQVCLGKLSPDLKKFESLIPLIGPDNDRNQKNWLPFVVDDEIILIYSHFPFILLKPILYGENKGKCVIWKKKEINKNLSYFRGSFSPIPYKDGYLHMVHRAIHKDNFFRYISRFVYMNCNLDQITLSREFYFFHIGVEYCAGAVWNGENIVVTVSKMDNESWICEIHKTEIEKKFKEFSLTL